MFGKIMVFILALGIGIAILRYSEPLVRTFGKSSFAEQYLGMGGSYTMWKLIALAVIIVGFLYLLGTITFGGWDKINVDQSNEVQLEESQ